MDPITGVGLAAAIIEIVRCTKAIHDRFKELHSEAEDVPEAFKELETQLPLMTQTLENIKEFAEKASLNQDVLKALDAVCEACDKEVRGIGAILDEVAPSKEVSTRDRARRVMKSFKIESKFKKSKITLKSHATELQMYLTSWLTTHQLSTALEINNRILHVRKELWTLRSIFTHHRRSLIQRS